MFSGHRLGFLLIGLLCAALPFLAVEFVPATDLPQHLAQVRMLEEIWGLAPATIDLKDAEVRLFGANTLVYVPLFLLARVFPVVLAGKLTVMLLVLLSVGALHALARKFERDPSHALVAGVLFFSLPLYWGFLNFLSGVPLFLWFLCFALAPPSPASARREAFALSLLMLGLYWAHVLWLAAAGLALVVGVLAHRLEPKVVMRRAAATLPAGALALYWYPTMAAARSRAGFDLTARYLQSPLERLGVEWFVGTLFGGIRGWFEVVATLALVAYAVFAWWASRTDANRTVCHPLLYLGVPFALFAFLAPDLYMNTILFGRRYLALGAMSLLLALPSVRVRLVQWAALAFAGVFALGTTFVWVVHDQDDLDGLREALAQVQEPKSVLGLNLGGSSQTTLLRGNPFLQTFAYFQAVHGGELSFSFAEHVSSIVAYSRPRTYTWQGGLDWFPERVTHTDLNAFDCALVNGNEREHLDFASFSGLRTRQEKSYFRLYCRSF